MGEELDLERQRLEDLKNELLKGTTIVEEFEVQITRKRRYIGLESKYTSDGYQYGLSEKDSKDEILSVTVPSISLTEIVDAILRPGPRKADG